MDNLEKLATQGTQYEEKHNIIYVGHNYAQTNTNNVNKLQTTGDKDQPNKIIMCIHTDIRLQMVNGKIIDRIVIYLPCNVTSTTTSLFCFMENRTPYINFSLAKKHLADKALKAMYEVLKMGRMHKLSIKCLLDLFDKMIKPILLYGCEVWGL